MGKHGAKQVPTQDLIKVWDGFENSNKKVYHIAQSIHHSTAFTIRVHSILQKYMTRFTDIKKPRANYSAAREFIVNRGLVNDSHEVKPVVQSTLFTPDPAPVTESAPLKALGAAKDAYEKALFIFIAYEVERQVGAVKIENAKLRKFVEVAKQDNLIGELNNHFNK
jgi:hypothetical protein